MTTVKEETIAAAIEILGSAGIEYGDVERLIRELVSDDMTSRRLIDWIPEAFGFVLVSHLSSKIVLPTTFSAKADSGRWVTLKLTDEPIFTTSLQMAQQMFHNGPREIFQNIALRSAMTNTANNALNAGTSLDGAVFSGPALIGIPANLYPQPPISFWRRLFAR